MNDNVCAICASFYVLEAIRYATVRASAEGSTADRTVALVTGIATALADLHDRFGREPVVNAPTRSGV